MCPTLCGTHDGQILAFAHVSVLQGGDFLPQVGYTVGEQCVVVPWLELCEAALLLFTGYTKDIWTPGKVLCTAEPSTDLFASPEHSGSPKPVSWACESCVLGAGREQQNFGWNRFLLSFFFVEKLKS